MNSGDGPKDIRVGDIVTKLNHDKLDAILGELLGEAQQDPNLSPEARELARAPVSLSTGEHTFVGEAIPVMSYGLVLAFGIAGGAFLKGFGQETGKLAAQELWVWLKDALRARPGQVEKLVDADVAPPTTRGGDDSAA